MSDHAADDAKAQKQSSPRYPFIPLSKAIERADQFRQAAGSNAAFVGDARKAWGYGLKSSGGDQTTAALSYYGLLDDMGSGLTRKLKLSDAAQRYFKDERPEIRAELLAKFALMPKAMVKLWELWKHEPPSDAIARSILKVDLHYSDYAANELLAVYRENLHFIPSGKSAISPEVSTEHANVGGTKGEIAPKVPAKVGEFVQWTSGGVDQFKGPMRVTWVSDDQAFLRVHGNPTGIPMNEATIMPAPKTLVAGGPVGGTAGGSDGELNVLLTGKRLQITADVDRAGLARLKELLTRYEGILELMDPDAPKN